VEVTVKYEEIAFPNNVTVSGMFLRFWGFFCGFVVDPSAFRLALRIMCHMIIKAINKKWPEHFLNKEANTAYL